MKIRHLATLAAAAVLCASAPAFAGGNSAVAGQKIDSGLGQLPHYSKWSDKRGRGVADTRVIGESLDDGVGSLPHYSQWADKTGRQLAALHVAGESLDDGVGSLPHYSQWVDRSGKNPLRGAAIVVSQATR